jgi:hypothetical protein
MQIGNTGTNEFMVGLIDDVRMMHGLEASRICYYLASRLSDAREQHRVAVLKCFSRRSCSAQQGKSRKPEHEKTTKSVDRNVDL